MNSRTARQKRRSRQRKLSFNKMPMADTLIDVESPSRIAFSGPDRNGRTQCCIANRTHILAVGYGENNEDALLSAAKTFIEDMADEVRMAVYGLDPDGATEADVAAAAMELDPPPELVAAEAEPGTFVGNNPTNPLHYVCPICEQGLNEKCASVRNGIELKHLHPERRRLGVEGA